jgi:hypothetical protein
MTQGGVAQRLGNAPTNCVVGYFSGAPPISLKKINLLPYSQRHHGFASGAAIMNGTD